MNEKQKLVDDATKVFQAQTTDEIIDVMEAEHAAARREKILRSMNPACQNKLKYIEEWFRKEIGHPLHSRYELGLQVKEMYDDEKRNAGKRRCAPNGCGWSSI